LSRKARHPKAGVTQCNFFCGKQEKNTVQVILIDYLSSNTAVNKKSFSYVNIPYCYMHHFVLNKGVKYILGQCLKSSFSENGIFKVPASTPFLGAQS
jgi:hypothetical protein